jgi:hypothetical protein
LSASRIRRAAKRREISIVKDSFSAWDDLHIYTTGKSRNAVRFLNRGVQ